MIIVVMGVSGSGKSTLGGALGGALGWQFIEADDFHPPANVARMRRGEPLDDADRRPWLAAISRHLLELDHQKQDAVLACSALKQSYRACLADGLNDTRFVHVGGDPRLIRRRLQSRKDDFMRAALLDSQLETLEPPLDAVAVPVDLATDAQVALVLRALQLDRSTCEQPAD